jgi:hypothetical protein
MKMFKRGGVDAVVNKFIYGFIGLVIIFALISQLYPSLVSYGQTYCSTGAPLSSFWATGSSVGWLIFGAVILIGLLVLIMKSFKHGGK